MEKPKKLITYKGSTINTIHYSDLSDKKFEELREQYYRKPNISLVKEELHKIKNASNRNMNITKYFFRDIMAKVSLDGNPWTIEEVFESKDVLGILYSFIHVNDKIFPPEVPDIDKIETALRIGPRVTQKPSNYPMQSVRDILTKYDINGNYYDYSCGWGVRLLGSLSTGLNYYGTDPNDLLTPRLRELGELYKKVNNSELVVDIRTHGSEEYIPEWENKIGVAFTSPPYFAYEDYRVGENQSYKKDETTYEMWLDNYWKGTVKNVHKYLLNEGAFLVNIQSYGKYKLQEDCKRIAEENGFYLVETMNLKTTARPTINNNEELTADEDIMVFAKTGYTLKSLETFEEDEW